MAAEVRAAVALGIPRSVLLGRVVAAGEPLWLPEDTDLVLAHFEVDDENCPGCGQPKAETFDPDNEWAYEGVTLACHACAARRRAERKLDNLDGIYSFTTKRGDRR